MYDIAMLLFAAIAAIGAVIAVLPLFGLDLRIIGRQRQPVEQLASAPRPTRKAWIALLIAIVSVGLSTGSFYYFTKPRIIEKTVETPIEKLTPCPEPKTPEATPLPRAKAHTEKKEAAPSTNPSQSSNTRPPTVINAPQGIGIAGGNVSNPTVNNYGPKLQIPNESVATLAGHLALCNSGSTVAVPNVVNPTSTTQHDAQNVVSAFAQSRRWQFSGLGQSIHGQDMGPNGPIPDPTGVHIYSDAVHKPLAECVRSAFASIGVSAVIENKDNQGDGLGILIGNAPQ
jgi:hypothetical protein